MSAPANDDGGDPRVHDLMDRMDDLGFSTAAVDGLASVLRDPHALKPNAPLTQIFTQLMADLACFAHGRVAERLGDSTIEVQQAILTVLREEAWPHTTLLQQGAQCLDTEEARILALDFLLGEVQAAKMIALGEYKAMMARNADAMAATSITDAPPSTASATVANKGQPPVKSAQPGKKRGGVADEEASAKRPKAESDSVAMEDVEASTADSSVPMEEDSEGSSQELSDELHLLAHTLQVVLNSAATSASSPPVQLNGVTALQLLRTRITSWLGESPAHAQAAVLPPLFKAGEFNAAQLRVLADIYRTFMADYSLRIRVMRKRLEVTLQSFAWGGKGKACAESLNRLAASKLATFPHVPQVDEYELWCATPAVLHIARLTSRDYAMRSSIKRVIIGKVPDRGGRVDTNTRLEPEYGMPQFTQRSTSGDSSGGQHRRGGGGGGGGGHHAGGGRGGGGGRRGGR